MTAWRFPNGSKSSRMTGGFILAEALVTMAISAFLLVALISLLHLMTRADARTAELSRRTEADSRAFDTLKRDLRSVTRTRWGGAGTDFVFSGSESRIQFAVRDPDAGEIEFVTLSAEDGIIGRVIRTSVAFPPFVRTSAELGAGVISEIYRGRSNVRFAYFSNLAGDQESLTDGWTQPLSMPSAIRVSLIDPNTRLIESSIRIPLMIDAEAGCAAPRRGLCSYVETGEADAVDISDFAPESIDPTDALGWMRYAR
jgi:general secretion pathway protein J